MTQAADLIRNQRRRFAMPGGSHDRLIRMLARVLPAGIGLIAAIMILAPLSPRGEISFLLDRNKVAIAKERVRVDNALYRGQDSLGRPFSVSAAGAVQESAKNPLVRMSDLTARIQLTDGPAQIHASGGSYDFDRETVAVDGVVDITAPDGYRMQSSGVTIDMKQKRLTGAGGISGAIPAGTFSANRIVADLDQRSVMLDGNARLSMVPGRMRMP